MKIVVGMDLTEEQRREFCEAAQGSIVEFVGAGKVTAENAADADAVFGNPPLKIVPELKGLRLLQLNSAGVNGYVEAIRDLPGARLCNASGAYGLTLSEYMLGALLMLMRRLHQYRDAQPSGQWKNLGAVRSVWGARILVLGLGDVGTMFAQRAKAMGAYVIGMKRTPGAKPDCVDELRTIDALNEVLPTVDAVCMSLPDTPQTRGILSAARIDSMKAGAYVVNVGRGSAIDQDALVRALNEGRLGGAALDVTNPEPLPPDHPLWTAQNCVLTPHVAGGYSLSRTKELVIEIMLENLRAFTSGAPLRSEIPLDRGY